jgi:hypothetical protein
MYRSSVAQFASELAIAQAMWRKYPDLVAAPNFPDKLRAAFVKESGQQPCEYELSDKFMQPGFKKKLREENIEYLRTKRRTTAA